MVKCEIMLALLWPLLPPIISQKLSENGVMEKNTKKTFQNRNDKRWVYIKRSDLIPGFPDNDFKYSSAALELVALQKPIP